MGKAADALEAAIYGIEPTVTETAARDAARSAAEQVIALKRVQIANGQRVEDAELRRVDILAPLVANLRALDAERDSLHERLLRVTELAKKTSPRIRELADAFDRVYAPLQQMSERAAPAGADPGRFDPRWEVPRRAHAALNQLVAHLETLAAAPPADYRPVAARLDEVRTRIVGALRDLGYSQPEIASLIDPDGYREDRALATDRIRKELKRLRPMAGPRADASATARPKCCWPRAEPATGAVPRPPEITPGAFRSDRNGSLCRVPVAHSAREEYSRCSKGDGGCATTTTCCSWRRWPLTAERR